MGYSDGQGVHGPLDRDPECDHPPGRNVNQAREYRQSIRTSAQQTTMPEISEDELLRALIEAAERERRRNQEYAWECPDCGEENEIDPAVVELCSEHWASCNDCGERYSLNLSGKP